MVATNGSRNHSIAPSGAASEVRAKVEARSGRVLLVDDNAVVREVLERILRLNGYDVVTAANGEEAVGMYRALSGAVDLVMLDMCMPGMDGYDTYRALRAVRADVTVILCSGAADPTRVEKALNEGVFAFLGKPFSASQVMTLVDAALQCNALTELPASLRACPGSQR